MKWNLFNGGNKVWFLIYKLNRNLGIRHDMFWFDDLANNTKGWTVLKLNAKLFSYSEALQYKLQMEKSIETIEKDEQPTFEINYKNYKNL